MHNLFHFRIWEKGSIYFRRIPQKLRDIPTHQCHLPSTQTPCLEEGYVLNQSIKDTV